MPRLVIPAGKTGADPAFQGKTWAQVAAENGVTIAVQGDQWCVDNHFPSDGLGIASDYVAPPPPPPPPGPTPLQVLITALADARTMDDVAAAAATAIAGGI